MASIWIHILGYKWASPNYPFKTQLPNLSNLQINRENRPLVTDEPVEFEKDSVEVQDFRKIADHFRGIWRIYLNLAQTLNREITTCHQRLDLETLGSRPIMSRNLPGHWLPSGQKEEKKFLRCIRVGRDRDAWPEVFCGFGACVCVELHHDPACGRASDHNVKEHYWIQWVYHLPAASIRWNNFRSTSLNQNLTTTFTSCWTWNWGGMISETKFDHHIHIMLDLEFEHHRNLSVCHPPDMNTCS
jgi:hypothetical protein